jgi:uncharacterized protein (DUF1778 family)
MMPSTKPVIALRLDEDLHKKVVAAAAVQGRTPANWIAFVVRSALSKKT